VTDPGPSAPNSASGQNCVRGEGRLAVEVLCVLSDEGIHFFILQACEEKEAAAETLLQRHQIEEGRKCRKNDTANANLDHVLPEPEGCQDHQRALQSHDRDNCLWPAYGCVQADHHATISPTAGARWRERTAHRGSSRSPRGRGLCNADPAHRGREEKEEHKGTLDDGSRDARLVKRLGAQAAAGLGLGRSPAWSRLGGWSGSVHPRDRIQWLTGTRKVVCWCRLRDRVCIGLESPLCCGRPGGRSRQACRTRNAHRARCGAQGWATLSPGTCSQRGVALWRALSFAHWQAGAGGVPGCS